MQAGRPEFDSRQEQRAFSFRHRVQTDSVASSYQTGTGGAFLEVRRPERETNHSLPSSVEVKNTWNYTSTPPYAFMSLCLVKHGDNFTSYVYVYSRIVLTAPKDLDKNFVS
jgi:hypothetical protein